jgi:hypothetical protein
LANLSAAVIYPGILALENVDTSINYFSVFIILGLDANVIDNFDPTLLMIVFKCYDKLLRYFKFNISVKCYKTILR